MDGKPTVFGYQPRDMATNATDFSAPYHADIFGADQKWIEKRRFDTKADAIAYARQIGAAFTC